MKTKILPVLLAVAFLSSALIVTADGSDAAKKFVIVDSNELDDDYDVPGFPSKLASISDLR